VFEIRTYTTEPGKLPDLLKRFREPHDEAVRKHGMTNIGYWVPTDEPRSKNTLIYILAHESRDAAKKNWDAFKADPEWIKVKDASEAGGKIVTKTESVFATDGLLALKVNRSAICVHRQPDSAGGLLISDP